MNYPEPIAKLIESYMKLPGIGQKTATREISISVVFAEILLKKILVKFAKIKIVTVVLF